jgi:hypothetical protein
MTMARTPQILRRPSAAAPEQSARPLPPQPPLIPLHGVWASLSPLQQQRLFHQLVRLCCGLLRPRAGSSPEESVHDAQ